MKSGNARRKQRRRDARRADVWDFFVAKALLASSPDYCLAYPEAALGKIGLAGINKKGLRRFADGLKRAGRWSSADYYSKVFLAAVEGQLSAAYVPKRGRFIWHDESSNLPLELPLPQPLDTQSGIADGLST